MIADLIIYLTLTNLVVFYNRSQYINTEVTIENTSLDQLRSIRGVVNMFYNENCSSVESQKNTNFVSIIRYNPNLRICCLPILTSNEEINCSCLRRRHCHAIMLPESTTLVTSCLQNRSTIQIPSHTVSIVYEIIGSSPVPIIKSICFSGEALGVCVSACVLFVLFLFMLSYSFDKYSREQTIEQSMLHPLSLEQVEVLFPSYSIPSPMDEECAICMTVFSNKDNLRKLSCNHVFHAKCIDPWIINYKAQCPICKSAVWKCNNSV
ncbi:hypothetical protein WA171_004040 [Blastocystis sp. BT1]